MWSFFFFFKQKTAYEMRISDWSSDVCSSDLMFCDRVAQQAAQLATMLGGLDAIVFTAGIGERSAPVRAAVAQRLAWLGAELDEGANAAGGPRISSAGSRLALLVVPTDEEAIIVRHTRTLLAERKSTRLNSSH